jgi:molybdopterin converting factor small subunit
MKMKLHLRYYGLVADRLGRSSEVVEWELGEATVDLRSRLVQLHPALATLRWKLAVDQEFVEGPCTVHEASEIVLLPPFAGG